MQNSAIGRGHLRPGASVALAVAALGSCSQPPVFGLGGVPVRSQSGAHAFEDLLSSSAQWCGAREAGVGTLIEDLAFTDADGRRRRLSDCTGSVALVVGIRHPACPLTAEYGASLARLEREYGSRGVAFLLVNVAPELAADAPGGEELERFGLEGRCVHDPGGELFGRALGLDGTASVFLLDAARTLRYRGAIDDRHVGGTASGEARHHYLREALDAVLEDMPVAVEATRSAGLPMSVARRELDPAGEVTYYREVARVLQVSCVPCHRTQGAAPFSLESYAEAFDRRRMLRQVVADGVMPPWRAAGDRGVWLNDLRLTDGDRAILLDWVERGAPPGDPEDAPRPIVWRAGWEIGEPDEVFRLFEEKVLPAEGEIQWDPVPADRRVPRDMWVERVQVLPTAPEVVHHATVFFCPPQPEPTPLDVLTPWTRKQSAWQPLGGYLPGKTPRKQVTSGARFVPKGSRIRFDMHYTPNGRVTVDRTMLGVKLAREEPRYQQDVETMAQTRLEIPPGETLVASKTLAIPCDVALTALTPHMHLRGRSFTAELILPDGRVESLIDIPQWDPDWQFSYMFARERFAPKGSAIRITGRFDNTSANLNNPDPTQWVRYGPQIWDEMLFMGVAMIRVRSEP